MHFTIFNNFGAIMTKLPEYVMNKLNPKPAEKVAYYAAATVCVTAVGYALYLGYRALDKKGYLDIKMPDSLRGLIGMDSASKGGVEETKGDGDE